ncbi:MAG: hypothetical protein J4F45_12630 [Pseudomonadales bacterium]|nr:hypothetical protein [Pseudomonadales bacterium]
MAEDLTSHQRSRLAPHTAIEDERHDDVIAVIVDVTAFGALPRYDSLECRESRIQPVASFA